MHDGQYATHAFGQLTGDAATSIAIENAGSHGISACGIRNGSHLGRLGEWAEQASSQGMVFLAFTNTGGGAKNVAPFGGYERKLSTNPVAFGIPTFSVLPFNIIVDFATSQISGSVIREHNRTSVPLNDEWTITDSGEAVADPQLFMQGMGALLPLGGRVTGHKGYGLSIVAELLGGLAGGLVVGQEEPDWFSNAAMFIVIDPTRFLPIEDFEERIAAIATQLRDDKVRLPGEGSHQQNRQSVARGPDIPDYVLTSLGRLAEELGIDVPGFISENINTAADRDSAQKTWV